MCVCLYIFMYMFVMVNAHALLLVRQWQWISSFVFYMQHSMPIDKDLLISTLNFAKKKTGFNNWCLDSDHFPFPFILFLSRWIL